jgi:hypothetical protein
MWLQPILEQFYSAAPAARSTAAISLHPSLPFLAYIMAVARAVHPLPSCDTFDGQTMGEGRYVVCVCDGGEGGEGNDREQIVVRKSEALTETLGYTTIFPLLLLKFRKLIQYQTY